jgi:hypothetical protein
MVTLEYYYGSDENDIKNPLFSELVEMEVIGDHMELEIFTNDCRLGLLNDYDGFGLLATEDEESNIVIKPSDLFQTNIPKWATHIIWYNN